VSANLILEALGVVELFSVTELEVVEIASLFITNVHVKLPHGNVIAKSVK
jgi:hypothetical protein